MNRLSIDKRSKIIQLLVEGNSIRGTSRIMDVSKNTVLKLLVEVGAACAWYQNTVFQKLNCKRIEVDEIWSFCYAKNKNVPPEYQGQVGYGDIWTWTSIDPDSRLVPCWMVGDRSAQSAHLFISDIASRMANRIQLTADGHTAYLTAVESVFGADVDFAMLVKIYGSNESQSKMNATDSFIQKISGNPNPNLISTSLVERQNLTMRSNIRRFVRRTNAHSKKIDNHAHAVALHFMYYNFARVHQSIRVSPAMAAGVTDRLWSIHEILEMSDGF